MSEETNDLELGMQKAISNLASGDTVDDGSTSSKVADAISSSSGVGDLSRKLGVSRDVAQQILLNVHGTAASVNGVLSNAGEMNSNKDNIVGVVSNALTSTAGVIGAGLDIVGAHSIGQGIMRGATNAQNYVNENWLDAKQQRIQKARAVSNINYNINSQRKYDEDVKNGSSELMANFRKIARDYGHELSTATLSEMNNMAASAIGQLIPSLVLAATTGGIGNVAQLAARGAGTVAAKMSSKALAASVLKASSTGLEKFGELSSKAFPRTLATNYALGNAFGRSQALETLDNMSDEELAKTPMYQQAYSKALEQANGDPVKAQEIARETVTNQYLSESGNKAGLAEAAVSGALIGLGKGLTKVPGISKYIPEEALTIEEQQIQKGIAKKILEGKGLENLTDTEKALIEKVQKSGGIKGNLLSLEKELKEETLQEGAGQITQNAIDKENIDPDRQLSEGVGEAAFGGTVGALGAKSVHSSKDAVKLGIVAPFAVAKGALKVAGKLNPFHKKAKGDESEDSELSLQEVAQAYADNPSDDSFNDLQEKVNTLSDDDLNDFADSSYEEVNNSVNEAQKSYDEVLNKEDASEEEIKQAKENLDKAKQVQDLVKVSDDDINEVHKALNEDGTKDTDLISEEEYTSLGSMQKKDAIAFLGNKLSTLQNQIANLRLDNTEGKNNDAIKELEDKSKALSKQMVNMYHNSISDVSSLDKNLQGTALLTNIPLQRMLENDNSGISKAMEIAGDEIIKGEIKPLNITQQGEYNTTKFIDTNHLDASNDSQYADEDIDAARDIHNSIHSMLMAFNKKDFTDDLILNQQGKVIKPGEGSDNTTYKDSYGLFQKRIDEVQDLIDEGRLVLSKKDSQAFSAVKAAMNNVKESRNNLMNLDLKDDFTDLKDEASENIDNLRNAYAQKNADKLRLSSYIIDGYKAAQNKNKKGFRAARNNILEYIKEHGDNLKALYTAKKNYEALQKAKVTATVSDIENGSFNGKAQSDNNYAVWEDGKEEANKRKVDREVKAIYEGLKAYNDMGYSNNIIPDNETDFKSKIEKGEYPVVLPVFNTSRPAVNTLAQFKDLIGFSGMSKDTPEDTNSIFKDYLDFMYQNSSEDTNKLGQAVGEKTTRDIQESFSVGNSAQRNADKKKSYTTSQKLKKRVRNFLRDKIVNNSNFERDGISKEEANKLKAMLLELASRGIIFGKNYAKTDSQKAIPELIAQAAGKNGIENSNVSWLRSYNEGNFDIEGLSPEEFSRARDTIDEGYSNEEDLIRNTFDSSSANTFAQGFSVSASLNDFNNAPTADTAKLIQIFSANREDIEAKSSLPKPDLGYNEPTRNSEDDDLAEDAINKRIQKTTDDDTLTEATVSQTIRNKLDKFVGKFLKPKGSETYHSNSMAHSLADNIFPNGIKSPLMKFWDNFESTADKGVGIFFSNMNGSTDFNSIKTITDGFISKGNFTESEKEFLRKFFEQEFIQDSFSKAVKDINTQLKEHIKEVKDGKISKDDFIKYENHRAYTPLIMEGGEDFKINDNAVAALALASIITAARYSNTAPKDPFIGNKDWEKVSDKEKEKLRSTLTETITPDLMAMDISRLFQDMLEVKPYEDADYASTAMDGVGLIGTFALNSAGAISMIQAPTAKALINKNTQEANQRITRIKFNENIQRYTDGNESVRYGAAHSAILSNIFKPHDDSEYVFGDKNLNKFLNPKDGKLISKFRDILHTFLPASQREVDVTTAKAKESFLPDMHMYRILRDLGREQAALTLLGLESKEDMNDMCTASKYAILSSYNQILASFDDMERVKELRIKEIKSEIENTKDAQAKAELQDFLDKFIKDDVSNEQLNKYRHIIGQHFVHQVTKVDRLNTEGHSAVGDKLKRLRETNCTTPMHVELTDNDLVIKKDDDKPFENNKTLKILARAVHQAFGNDIWKVEPEDSYKWYRDMLVSLKDKMKNDSTFKENLDKLDSKNPADRQAAIRDFIKLFQEEYGASLGEPVALQGIFETLNLIKNNKLDSTSYIEFDGKSCGPATQYSRFGAELAEGDLEAAWRTGYFYGYPGDRRTLEQDVKKLEAIKPEDRTSIQKEQLTAYKDILDNDGYMKMAVCSAKHCDRVRDVAKKAGEESERIYNDFKRVMQHTTIIANGYAINADIPTKDAKLTKTLRKAFRNLAKLIGTPMVYGAGSSAEADTISQGLLRGFEEKMYKTLQHMRKNGVDTSANFQFSTWLKNFAEANGFENTADAKEYLKAFQTVISYATNVTRNANKGDFGITYQKGKGHEFFNQMLAADDLGKDKVSNKYSYQSFTQGMSWSTANETCIKSMVHTFVTEPMNWGASDAFPHSAKETVNALTSLSGAMGLVNGLILAHIVRAIIKQHKGQLTVAQENALMNDAFIQRLFQVTSLPHSDGYTSFYNYKFSHDAATMTTSNQNSAKVTQNGLTLTTRPNVLKYLLMGVTIQPGVTQGSGDADIMSRVIMEIYQQGMHIGSMFDGLNFFTEHLNEGSKAIDALGNASRKSAQQNISLQMLTNLNNLTKFFNDNPELLYANRIGLASNPLVARAFIEKMLNIAESYSYENNDLALKISRIKKELKDTRNFASLIQRSMDCAGEVLKLKAVRHEAKNAAIFGTPRKNAVGGYNNSLYVDLIDRNKDGLLGNLHNFDTMEFGNAEVTPGAYYNDKSGFIVVDGNLQRTTIGNGMTAEEYREKVSPRMVKEYIERTQEDLLKNNPEMFSYIKKEVLNDAPKGMDAEQAEELPIPSVETVHNLISSKISKIRHSMKNTGASKISALGTKLNILKDFWNDVFKSLPDSKRAIKNASVIPFDFNSLDSSTDETELLNKIKEKFHVEDSEASQILSNLKELTKPYKNHLKDLKGLHINKDYVLVNQEIFNEALKDNAPTKNVEDLLNVLNHEVSHMSILDSVSFCIENVRPVLENPTDENYKNLFNTMNPNSLLHLDDKKLLKFKAFINDLNKVTVDTETVGKNIQAMLRNIYKNALKDSRNDLSHLDLPTENIKRAKKLINSLEQDIKSNNFKDFLKHLEMLKNASSSHAETIQNYITKGIDTSLGLGPLHSNDADAYTMVRNALNEIALCKDTDSLVHETITWFMNVRAFSDMIKGLSKDSNLAKELNKGIESSYKTIEDMQLGEFLGKALYNLWHIVSNSILRLFGVNSKEDKLTAYNLLKTASAVYVGTPFKPNGSKTTGHAMLESSSEGKSSPKASPRTFKGKLTEIDKYLNKFKDDFFKQAVKDVNVVNNAIKAIEQEMGTPILDQDQRTKFDYTLHSMLAGIGDGSEALSNLIYLAGKAVNLNMDNFSETDKQVINSIMKKIPSTVLKGKVLTALVCNNPTMFKAVKKTKGISTPKIEADLEREEAFADAWNNIVENIDTIISPDHANLTLNKAFENYIKGSWDEFQSFDTKLKPYERGGIVPQSKLGNLLDKADDAVVSAIKGSARKISDLTDNAKSSTGRFIHSVANATENIFSVEANNIEGNDLYDDLERWADSHLDQNKFFQNFLKQQIREFTNHTRGTNDYHNMKKISKNKVQQNAEALRSRVPRSLHKTCKDCKDWIAANNLFAKGSFFKSKISVNGLRNYLNNINSVYADINNLGLSNDVHKAVKNLVQFVQSGKCSHPNSLIRNTYAIAQLKGVDSTSVNRLYTLYTIAYLHKHKLSQFNEMKKFLNADTTGEQTTFIQKLLVSLYATDLKKISETPEIKGQRNVAYNFTEGYIPTVEDHQTVMTKDPSKIEELKKLGWKEVKVSKNGIHHFTNDIVVQSFHSGALQVVNNTAMGVNLDSRFTEGTHPYTEGMKSNEDEMVVPYFISGAKKSHYELVKVQHEEQALDTLLGDWTARHIIEQNVDSANDKVMYELRKLYEAEPTSPRNINLSKLVDKDGKIIDSEFKKANLSKYQRKAIERLFNCPRILPVINKYFPDGLIVRRDLIDDALGMESASVVDIYTGNNELPELINTSLQMFFKLLGGERGAMQLEAELRAVTKMTKNSIVIKSVVVPIANFIANNVQMWMSGIPAHVIIKGWWKKTMECNRYISYTRELADLKIRKLNGENVDAQINNIKAKIDAMSIAPLINLGEFNTIQDGTDSETKDTGSYFNKAVNYASKKFSQNPILQELSVNEKTLFYKTWERTTQYGDFIAKSICYDYWTKKYGTKEAIYRVTSEFVDYDFMPSRGREWLEKIGWGWYWNYKLRMSKVMMRMIRENPFRSLMFLTIPPTLFDIDLDTPFKDSALGRALGMGPSLHSSLGFGHLFHLKNYIPIAGMF